MNKVIQRALLIALLLGGATTVVLVPAALHAQARSKRLVLRDGSFQSTSKWETKGDRIRYYSTDRFEWEEVPNSLIDWDATNKYNAQSAEDQTKAKEVDAEAAAERAKEEAATPEVAAGLRLPAN